MEKLFIVNLDVLSSVLYRWRNLEAIVKIKLKTDTGGLSPKPENISELLNSGNIKQ